jgi:uncharacterized 2Fe-2S/4Fe-4S cluster protein (DUF4445 family)
MSGELSPASALEAKRLTPRELASGYRLACQAVPRTDVRLEVPAESLSTAQRTQVEGELVPVEPSPVVRACEIHLSPPSMTDLLADSERVALALQQQHGVLCGRVDLEALRHASGVLRDEGWLVQAVLRGDECLALRPSGRPLLGLAVDMGTTKVAGYLVDLTTGRTLASRGMMNPQIAYGEDLVTRLARVLESPGEAHTLQELALQALNGVARDLLSEVAGREDDIVDAVVVGNTAIHHLLLRLPVAQLALAPYVPAVSAALDVRARDIGWKLAPGAYVHILPNIAGYVGADHVAMILATGLPATERTVLALDIGTNTEICLAHRGRLQSVSCASGPAFEGAHIEHGMRAARGAIERLYLGDTGPEYQTVEGAPAVGVCGSGIVDALAALYGAGVVDRRGRMLEHEGVRGQGAAREFVIVSEERREGKPAITITQRDVRELQLAKGAIRTGIEALLEANGLSEKDIDEVIIAGAFGSYIDVSSAITIGMLPELPLTRFRQVGNAAGVGARLCLISAEQRRLAAETASRVEYLELAGLPDFATLFANSTYLGPYHVGQGRGLAAK